MTLSACSVRDDGAGSAGQGERTSAEPSEPSTTSPTATALPVIDPWTVELGPVCRQEAVLLGAEPYPGEVALMQGFLTIEAIPFPDTAPATRGLYVPVGLEKDWAVPPTTLDWDAVNAVICVDVVPGSDYVRFACEGEVEGGGTATWEIWGTQLQTRIIDPTTGELVAEDEPFDSDELLPTLQCGTAPTGLEAGGHGYTTDLPFGFMTAERVDRFLRTLD